MATCHTVAIIGMTHKHREQWMLGLNRVTLAQEHIYLYLLLLLSLVSGSPTNVIQIAPTFYQNTLLCPFHLGTVRFFISQCDRTDT